MKIVKLSKRIWIDNNGNYYYNGKIKKLQKGKRKLIHLNGQPVRQLAWYIGYYFVPGYKEGLVIDHIDFDPSNCHLSNLQWLTQSINTQRTKDYYNHNNLSSQIRAHYGIKISRKIIIRDLIWYKRHGKFRWE